MRLMRMAKLEVRRWATLTFFLIYYLLFFLIIVLSTLFAHVHPSIVREKMADSGIVYLQSESALATKIPKNNETSIKTSTSQGRSSHHLPEIE